jgi:hypothetical protein
LPGGLPEKLDAINTNYRNSTKSDVEGYVLESLERIQASGAKRDRNENFSVWEKGWSENLEAILNESFHEDHLRPKYFRPSRFFRFQKEIVLPENASLEHDLFTIVRSYFFHKYFSEFSTAYELGCGSCQNIYALSQAFPHMTIYGLDWAPASNRIAELINEQVKACVKGMQFDMLAPPMDFKIAPQAIIFSIHSLEQLHTDYDALISFLLTKKPALVFHYEPILEFYDESNVYDYLALTYSRSRGYLSGYLSALRALESAGRIRILEQYRPYIGGVYHEASLIVWKPL